MVDALVVYTNNHHTNCKNNIFTLRSTPEQRTDISPNIDFCPKNLSKKQLGVF